MKRRAFLSLLGAAVSAPVLPLAAAGQVPPYNRVTYGYAVFWARHGGRFGARQLAKAMRVSLPQAEAMIADMAKDRIVRSAAGGALRANAVHGGGRLAGQLANTSQARPSQARRQLYWRFRRVGLRAKALQSQLHHSDRTRAPMRVLT